MTRTPTFRLHAVISFACLMFAAPVFAQTKVDESALRGLPTRFCEAWAAHDGHALAAIMADNVDFVTVGAIWLHGRADFETYHTRLLSGRFKGSTNTPVAIDVRFLRPYIAAVRWTWSIQDDKNADGTLRPKRLGLMTMIAEKRKGDWLIVAAQNTNAASQPSPEANGIRSPLAIP